VVDSSMVIPASAVVERGQLTGVFVFAPDSTVRLRWIRLGRRTLDRYEVVSGLRPTDLIVADPGAVRDGEPALPAAAGASGQ